MNGWMFSDSDGELYCPDCVEDLIKYSRRYGFTKPTLDQLQGFRIADDTLWLDCGNDNCFNTKQIT